MTRRKPKARRWVAVSSALAPNMRELVTMLIDDQGRLWELSGKDSKPILVSPAPPKP
jgi:hypothetical protein